MKLPKRSGRSFYRRSRLQSVAFKGPSSRITSTQQDHTDLGSVSGELPRYVTQVLCAVILSGRHVGCCQRLGRRNLKVSRTPSWKNKPHERNTCHHFTALSTWDDPCAPFPRGSHLLFLGMLTPRVTFRGAVQSMDCSQKEPRGGVNSASRFRPASGRTHRRSLVTMMTLF